VIVVGLLVAVIVVGLLVAVIVGDAAVGL